jgi:hypothetical protein
MKIRTELTLDIMVAIRNQVLFAEQRNKKSTTLKELRDEINAAHYYIKPKYDHKPEYEYALKAIEKEGYIKISGDDVNFVRYIFEGGAE